MQHKTVRTKPGGALRNLADFGDHRPCPLRRIKVRIGRQMHMQTRPFTGNDAAQFPNFRGGNKVFVALSGFRQQQRHILAPFRCKTDCRNIPRVQQKRGCPQFDLRDSVFFQTDASPVPGSPPDDKKRTCAFRNSFTRHNRQEGQRTQPLRQDSRTRRL